MSPNNSSDTGKSEEVPHCALSEMEMGRAFPEQESSVIEVSRDISKVLEGREEQALEAGRQRERFIPRIEAYMQFYLFVVLEFLRMALYGLMALFFLQNLLLALFLYMAAFAFAISSYALTTWNVFLCREKAKLPEVSLRKHLWISGLAVLSAILLVFGGILLLHQKIAAAARPSVLSAISRLLGNLAGHADAAALTDNLLALRFSLPAPLLLLASCILLALCNVAASGMVLTAFDDNRVDPCVGFFLLLLFMLMIATLAAGAVGPPSLLLYRKVLPNRTSEILSQHIFHTLSKKEDGFLFWIFPLFSFDSIVSFSVLVTILKNRRRKLFLEDNTRAKLLWSLLYYFIRVTIFGGLILGVFSKGTDSSFTHILQHGQPATTPTTLKG